MPLIGTLHLFPFFVYTTSFIAHVRIPNVPTFTKSFLFFFLRKGGGGMESFSSPFRRCQRRRNNVHPPSRHPWQGRKKKRRREIIIKRRAKEDRKEKKKCREMVMQTVWQTFSFRASSHHSKPSSLGSKHSKCLHPAGTAVMPSPNP